MVANARSESVKEGGAYVEREVFIQEVAASVVMCSLYGTPNL